MLKIGNLRHSFPERAGFCVNHPEGYTGYSLLHFHTPVHIMLNGKLIRTNPHAVVLLDKNMPKYYYSDTPMIHDWIHFHSTDLSWLQDNGLQFSRIYYPTDPGFLSQLSAEVEMEFYNPLTDSDRLISLKLEELFLRLGRSVSNRSRPNVPQKTWYAFRFLREAVFSSLQEPWTIEIMAKRVNFSPSRFSVVYKKVFGISPTADLIRARIQAAESMLRSTDTPIIHVAQQLGYQNVTHFIRQFKAHTGISPSQYRKASFSDTPVIDGKIEP